MDTCEGHQHDYHAGCHQVANNLYLGMCAPDTAIRLAPDREIEKSYVIVVSNPDDARVVKPAIRVYPIRAVIVWHLPEVIVSELLSVSIPVFVGLPDLDQWQMAMEEPFDYELRQQQIQHCSQYALLEGQMYDSINQLYASV